MLDARILEIVGLLQRVSAREGGEIMLSPLVVVGVRRQRLRGLSVLFFVFLFFFFFFFLWLVASELNNVQ